MGKKKKKSSNALEIQNAAKTLFANIKFASVDDPIRTVALTSAVPNEGKTTASLNLAQAIASSGKKVLLVEADMRRRSLAAEMGIHPRNGAYSVMSGMVSLDEAVVSTPTPMLYFLDIEPNIPNPADLLSSKAYARLVEELDAAYDYVIFDTPPVGTFVDAALLSRLVDGVIMVVKVNGAKRDEILAAYEQLRKAEAHMLGVCATFYENTSSEYYYAYYNKDNQRVDKSKGGRGASTPAPAPTSVPAGRSSTPRVHSAPMASQAPASRMPRGGAAAGRYQTPAPRGNAAGMGAAGAPRSNTPSVNSASKGRKKH